MNHHDAGARPRSVSYRLRGPRASLSPAVSEHEPQVVVSTDRTRPESWIQESKNPAPCCSCSRFAARLRFNLARGEQARSKNADRGQAEQTCLVQCTQRCRQSFRDTRVV
eukprot:766785-Hanusia_phi.AAC.2